jgi:hypothetical protein
MIALNMNSKIVDKEGRMTPAFINFLRVVSNLDLEVGTGSPEGVVEAGQGKLYIDTDGGPGAMLYTKRDTTSDTTGWILV